MGDIAGGHELYVEPSVNYGAPSLPLSQDSGLTASYTPSGDVMKSGGNFWDYANNILDLVGKGANAANTIVQTVKGNPAQTMYLPTSVPNISGLGSLVSSGNSLGSSMPGVTGVLDYADSFLANSQTLNNATSSLGTSLGQQVGSTIKKYGVVLAGLLVAVLLVVFFKSSGNKKY